MAKRSETNRVTLTGSGWETVLTLTGVQDGKASVELVNNGPGALTGARLQFQVHPGGAWHDYVPKTEWTEWIAAGLDRVSWKSTPDAGTQPDDLASGNTAWWIVRSEPVAGWRIQVQGPADTEVDAAGTHSE